MSLFITILFWLGIVGLVDGSLGILFQDKWSKLVSGINIQRIALIEIGIALAFLAAHFLLAANMG
jgi:hypothetical protein